MSNRHSAGIAVQWRITRPALAFICVLILGVVAASAMAIRNFGSSTTAPQTCARSVTIRVAAAPAMVKPMQTHADRWNQIHFVRNGKCIKAAVYEASASTEAALLATSSADKPTIWIPDSSYWVEKLQNDLKTRGKDGHIQTLTAHPALAISPLVLVTTPAKSAALAAKGGVTWASIEGAGSNLAMENPLVSSEGLVGLAAIESTLGTQPGFNLSHSIAGMAPKALPDADAGFAMLLADPKTAPMFLATEQEVAAENAAHKSTFAAATYPSDGTLSLDYPAVRLDYPGDDPVLGPGADGFYESFAAGAAELVNPVGLRDSTGVAKPLSGADVSTFALPFTKLPTPAPGTANAVWSAWPVTTRNARVLFAMDISTLMQADVGNGESMVSMETSSAISLASNYLPDSAQFGLWGYATHLTSTLDWLEQVSLGPLGAPYNNGTRRQAVQAQTALVNKQTNDGSAVYDTALAAFYNVTNNYVPGRMNAVVLMTGSGNRDASSVTLDQLLTTLRQRFNPAKPVHIISIAIGDGADNSALNLIAAATGGSSYIAESSAQALQILLDNFVQQPS
ncbi:extracellular solute-binding protein [Frankineae bacterium MT45]|nr:extracellular solute-binding protein [Frankineae bacterium MT45]